MEEAKAEFLKYVEEHPIHKMEKEEIEKGWSLYLKWDKLFNSSRGKRYQDQENNTPTETHPTGKHQVLFVTLTLRATEDPESKQEQQLRDRIHRIVSQRSYPIVRWCGVLAHTAKGTLHAHLMLLHLLKKSNGKWNYLKPSFLQKHYNQGDLVNIKRVNSFLASQYCENYMNNQEHDTSDTLIFLNDHKKFFEYLETNKCHFWVNQENGGDEKSDKEEE